MKDIKEIYQALLDGKTLRHERGYETTLETSGGHNFNNPEKWEIYEPKWEMKPAMWYICTKGDIGAGADEVTEVQKFGMKYHSKKQAEKARDQMRIANLLRYWVSTMQDLDEGTFYIVFDKAINKYFRMNDPNKYSIAEVYMTEDTAVRICEALNNKDIKLR
jgi:hypothetical protein